MLKKKPTSFEERFKAKIQVVNKDGSRTSLANGEVEQRPIEVFLSPNDARSNWKKLLASPSASPSSSSTPSSFAQQSKLNRIQNNQDRLSIYHRHMEPDSESVSSAGVAHVRHNISYDDDEYTPRYTPSTYNKSPSSVMERRFRAERVSDRKRSFSSPSRPVEDQKVQYLRSPNNFYDERDHRRSKSFEIVEDVQESDEEDEEEDEEDEDVPEEQKLYYSRKPREVKYRPYKLEEYKMINLPVKLGGLGANINSEKHKEMSEKAKRARDYARNIKAANQVRLSRSPKKDSPQEEKVSKRQRALEFASKISKPSKRKSVSGKDQNTNPNKKSNDGPMDPSEGKPMIWLEDEYIL